MKALYPTFLCLTLSLPVRADDMTQLRKSLEGFKARPEVGRAPPVAAGLPACEAGRLPPAGGCLMTSDLENMSGTLLRHPRGWVVHESCFNRFAGENVVSILEEAWKRIDPSGRTGREACLGKYNPRWASEVAAKVSSGRVLITCGGGKGCAVTGASHRYRGTHGPDGFKRTSTMGERWETIALEDVVNCRAVNGMSFPSIVFHETLHAAGAPMVNPLAHDASWRAYDATDVIYSAQATCFYPPGSTYRTTTAQCEAVVRHGNPNAQTASLCVGFNGR